jgi:uncharacterized protein
MTPCFADTFYFIALLNPQDQSHQQALSFANNSRRPIVTTTWVLLELGNYLATTAKRNIFADFVRFLRNQPRAEIISANDQLFDRGLALYDQRPDKQWSLTDCISFIVMQDHQLTDALTGDHHFEQAGFVAMLK